MTKAEEIFNSKAEYNKWLKELTDDEKELVLEMINEAFRQCNVSGQLPDFLYEYEGQIRIGYHGGTEVTDEWRKWKEGNLR